LLNTEIFQSKDVDSAFTTNFKSVSSPALMLNNQQLYFLIVLVDLVLFTTSVSDLREKKKTLYTTTAKRLENISEMMKMVLKSMYGNQLRQKGVNNFFLYSVLTNVPMFKTLNKHF
jgi:hypothetical protein